MTDSDKPDLTEAMRMRDIALAALADAKGQDVAVLDVTGLTDICDFMVVATGTSDRHVRTLADRVLEQMHEAGWRQMGVEGDDARDWVLVDFVDVVIHIMRAETRKRYDLESLWDKTFAGLRHEAPAEEGDPAAEPALTAEEAARILRSGGTA